MTQGITIDTIAGSMSVQDAIRSLRSNPRGIRFSELVTICDLFFGTPRQRGMAKAYQVRQVIRALEMLEDRPNDAT